MSDEIARWPLPPRHAAHTLHGLAVAMADVLQHANGNIPERELAKMVSLCEAAELIAVELVRFFASRPDEDHRQLEDICRRYLEEAR